MGLIELGLSEASRHLADRPFWRLQVFAARFNWHGLTPHVSRVDGASAPLPNDGIVIRYQAGEDDFCLNLVETPWGNPSRYTAHVRATRYGIACSGMHKFTLYTDEEQLISEAKRLACFLLRDNDLDPAWCINFAGEFPELRNAEAAPNDV
jgi:hypothetical protein